MKYKINQFFNIETHEHEKWYIAIKSERDKKYHILMNGSVPHIFGTEDEAKNYLDSVRDDIEWLVKNELAYYHLMRKKRAKVSAEHIAG